MCIYLFYFGFRAFKCSVLSELIILIYLKCKRNKCIDDVPVKIHTVLNSQMKMWDPIEGKRAVVSQDVDGGMRLRTL